MIIELKICKPSSNRYVSISGNIVDGIESYLGIPYAEPPVNNLRWKAPVPVSLYDYDKLDATKFGNASIQGIPISQSNVLGDGVTEDEDCLYLNIWTTGGGEKKKRPVVFFLHGGGFIVWSSSVKVFDGTVLAKEHDVVIVSFNYRLSVLGFLHTGVNKKEYETDGDHCNFGLLDWVAALRWVSKHIHHFGGDADNVTIMGQSAGAEGVHMLLSSPQAEGLFHKVILISRGGDDYGYNKVVPEDNKRLLEGSKKYIEFLIDKKLDESDNAQELLAAVPIEKIKKSFMQFTRVPPTSENGGPLCFFTQIIFSPSVDEKTLLSDFTPWTKSNVKIVFGATSHEGRFTIKPWGTLQFPDPSTIYTKETLAMMTKALVGTSDEEMLNIFYDLQEKEDTHVTYYNALVHLITTAVFVEPAYALSQRLTNVKSIPAYMYLFSRVCPGAKKTNELSYHCVDIPYIFGTLQQRRAIKSIILTDDQEEEGYFEDIDFKLSKEIRNALFTNFAHTGIPTFENGEAWPLVSEDLNIAVMNKHISSENFKEKMSVLLTYLYNLR